MRYAFISDIHGNLPALKAVIRDIENREVDHIVFLGDYYGFFHEPAEIANLIQKTPNAIPIKGNWEGYLETGDDEDVARRNQLMPIRWGHSQLTDDQLAFFTDLPTSIELGNNKDIYCAHWIKDNYKDSALQTIKSSDFSKYHKGLGWSRQDYISHLVERIKDDSPLMAELTKDPHNVHVFGHNHLQTTIKIGDKLLINPGACGVALDGEVGAPYTILTWEDGLYEVDERRVDYDRQGLASALKSSDFYQVSRPWCNLAIRILDHPLEEIKGMFTYVHEYAKAHDCQGFPFENHIWDEATRLWDEDPELRAVYTAY